MKETAPTRTVEITPNPPTGTGVYEKALFTSLDENLGVDEEIAEKLLHEMDAYFALHGGKREFNFNKYIHLISAKYPHMIVRRENPDELFNSLETGEPISIRFRKDEHDSVAYPNAAEIGWDGSGLRIPYQWGFGKVGKGKVVVVIGFTPNTESVINVPLPANSHPNYTDKKIREKIRMVEGDIDVKDDLKFAIVRFPRKFFPENEMTDEELEQINVFHISRAYSFSDDTQKESH